ncbi:MAG: TlpA disulfide reductase family protein [Polaribacter sp.]|uniref:peroxiredoxin family protein n=1 Tax=Polaribacter sp. TaxID=1920175 RepID=UPI002F3502E8
MKNIVIFTVFFLYITEISSQNRMTFPHNVILKDKKNKNVTSKIFYNFEKPIIIDYWATYCKPCIQKLDDLKDVYKEWQDRYGLQIIVISIDKKSKRKQALKIIEKHNWPFQFYFDHNKELLKKLSDINLVPLSFILDGKFNVVKTFSGAKFWMLPIDNSEEKRLKTDLRNYEKVLDSLVKKK